MTEPLGEKAASPKKPVPAAAALPVEGERVCTACGRHFGPGTLFCPDDGTPLEVRGSKSTDPYLGQVILDHIEIQKLAGVGAMGRVYRAFQRGLERDVAVKILHRELSSNKELVGRFIREAKLASRIVHPNVVQVHLAGQLPDGALYIVMEYLDGLSLQSAMAASPSGALVLERSLHVALQLSQAVGEAHELGIVHRDLKPENVMLVRRGDDHDFVKVLDFGIARASQAEHASMATAQGLIFGTARYISPEGARGEGATAASDVYSLAILFYQLFAGHTPFDAEQAVGLLLQHIHETPPPLVAPPSHPAVPPAIAKVILGSLAKSAADRAPNARRFGEELRRAARESGLFSAELETLSRRPAALAATPTPAPAPLAEVAAAAYHRASGAGEEGAGRGRVGGTEIAEPERRASASTEIAEPDPRGRGLTDNGTLRLDTPPPAMLALSQREALGYKGHDRTLPVVSRPPELLRHHTPVLTEAHGASEAAAESEGGARRWLLLLLVLVPVVVGGGLLLGGALRPERKPPVVPVPPPVHTPAPAELTPVADPELVELIPEKRPPEPGPGPGPGPAPPNRIPGPGPGPNPPAQAGGVRVTVGRSMATPIPNHPLEFTAVVFDGADRAGSKVEAANFSFRGEGMSSTLPAMLDSQGIFRVQLTFYKPGTYDVIFGGMLNGRSIGGSHRFTIAPDGAAVPPPRASSAPPPLPGPNPAPAPNPTPAVPAPKPPSSVQWL